MSLRLQLNCKGKSLNHSKVPFRGRLIPSDSFKKDKAIYNNELLPYKRDLIHFLNKEIHQVNGLTINVCFFFKNFLTKKNTISQAIPDLDNMLKGLIDCIFEQAGAKDHIVLKINAQKLPSDSDKIVVHIEEYYKEVEEKLASIAKDRLE